MQLFREVDVARTEDEAGAGPEDGSGAEDDLAAAAVVEQVHREADDDVALLLE